MKMYSECIPCLFKIALDTIVAYGVPEREHRAILARYSEILFSLPDGVTAPEISAVLTRLLAGYGSARRDV
ncbi:MAG: hypothetical protein PHW69_09075, partial [Elusimicrobiaceae bacterium]|nr:hypothetical protein [Elusimicrobiaceae bacterium]